MHGSGTQWLFWDKACIAVGFTCNVFNNGYMPICLEITWGLLAIFPKKGRCTSGTKTNFCWFSGYSLTPCACACMYVGIYVGQCACASVSSNAWWTIMDCSKVCKLLFETLYLNTLSLQVCVTVCETTGNVSLTCCCMQHFVNLTGNVSLTCCCMQHLSQSIPKQFLLSSGLHISHCNDSCRCSIGMVDLTCYN